MATPRHALQSTLLWTSSAAMLLAGVAAVVVVSSHQPATAASMVAAVSLDPTPVSGNRLAQDLLGAGLSPEQLCASGATVAQAASAWTAAAAEARSVAIDMDRARAQIESASQLVQRLERLVRRGQADAAELDELATQRVRLATHAATRDRLIAGIRAQAMAVLNPAIQGKLNRLYEADLGLDAMYRVVSRDQIDAVALREAIADVHVSSKRGREPATESTRLIADAETDPAVAAAKIHMASRLGPMQAEWEAFLRGD